MERDQYFPIVYGRSLIKGRTVFCVSTNTRLDEFGSTSQVLASEHYGMDQGDKVVTQGQVDGTTGESIFREVYTESGGTLYRWKSNYQHVSSLSAQELVSPSSHTPKNSTDLPVLL